ncbi:putative plant self-incompatibility S1 [Arabidopsis thaliana]
MASSSNQNFIFLLIFFLAVHKTSSSFGNYSNKGDDLGVISLQHLARFDFRFHVNLRKTTKYTCSFEWPGNTATFDIFRADRDDNPSGKYGVCSECIWSIYEPAPCRDRRDGGQPQCFPWAS